MACFPELLPQVLWGWMGPPHLPSGWGEEKAFFLMDERLQAGTGLFFFFLYLKIFFFFFVSKNESDVTQSNRKTIEAS